MEEEGGGWRRRVEEEGGGGWSMHAALPACYQQVGKDVLRSGVMVRVNLTLGLT